MADGRKDVTPRTDRELPGVWRLRLPCPWPGVPHGNAWAIAHDGGIVLFDTGLGGKGRLRALELALASAGFGIEDVKLVVCTHAHTDHFGLAGPISEAAGCEYWIHPLWGHARMATAEPEAALERRLEVARQSGVPLKALERYRQSRDEDEEDNLVEGMREPDRPLVPGVEVETDLGPWTVHFTPGHAPSHVVLHQMERRLLITGDHLLGRTVLFFDYGHTPDPVGEYLGSLEVVEGLGVDLCLPGHGRTFRDPQAKIDDGRRQVAENLDRIRGVLGGGERTAFEVVNELASPAQLSQPASGFMLQVVLAHLDHLAALGEVEVVEGSEPKRWRLG
jgi:glyoxylase-like metal-dependent hydrolase (beta-lactamase superfamily II)